MSWDPAERTIREVVRDALQVLLEQHREATAAEREAAIRRLIREEVAEYQRRAVATNEPMLADPSATEQRLVDELLGLGPLERLMRDPAVQTIFVNTPTHVRVVRDGRTERVAGVRFEGDQQVRDLVKRLATLAGRRFDESSPRADLALPDGSRLHALMPPITPEYTEVTIRKFTLFDRRLPDLVAVDTLPPDLATFLAAAVRAKANLVIAGDGGAGKTTLLRVLALEIDDPDERVIVVESTRELALHRLLPHCLSWQARPANSEGLGAISQGELVEDDALRCEPSRIIVGEARGAEAYTLLEAMNTGHRGSMSTIHATSARDALRRLKVAAMKAAERPSPELLTELIAANVDLVLYLEKRLGRRWVTQVVEVDPRVEGGVIACRDLWVERNGRLARTGLRPQLLDRIEAAAIPYAWEVVAA